MNYNLECLSGEEKETGKSPGENLQIKHENQQQTRSNSVRCLGLIVTAVQNCTDTEHCSIRETTVGFFSSVLLVQEELHIKEMAVYFVYSVVIPEHCNF